jgi:hypothetical protein
VLPAFSHQQRKENNKMNAVLNTPQTERITLYYREGSSDKVYQATIEPRGEGFVVTFALGCTFCVAHRKNRPASDPETGEKCPLTPPPSVR